MSLPSRRWSRVVAPVLVGAGLIIGGVFVGRASRPAPRVDEVVYGEWRSAYATRAGNGHGETLMVAPRPAGGFVILHAITTVELVIAPPAVPPRTIVFDDIAPPHAYDCGWGGCRYEGPMLLDEGELLVVVGPHARWNGVLRAQISTDGGETWVGRDVASNVHGSMTYMLYDGVLQWYSEVRRWKPNGTSWPLRLRGHLRIM